MRVPVEITFHRVDPSPALEEAIRQRVEKLERYYDRITRCRVAVECPHKSHTKGNQYQVRIDLTVPGGELVVNRDSAKNDHTDAYIAVRDAFNSMERELHAFAGRRRELVRAAV